METTGRDSGEPQEGRDPAGTIRWRPSEHCLQQLLAMGIDRNAAIKGLYYTGNHSAEFAAAYVFDNQDADDELDPSIRIESEQKQPVDASLCKMVLVVNGSLGMSVGKTASQVAHAALGLYRILTTGAVCNAALIPAWEENGEKKVVVVAEDVAQLRQLEEQAVELNVPYYVLQDAGRTEVAPGSVTALALFGVEDQVNAITGHLPLL